MKNILTVTLLFSFFAVALLLPVGSNAGFGPWAKKHKSINYPAASGRGINYRSFPRSVDRESMFQQTWIPAQKTTGMTNVASHGVLNPGYAIKAENGLVQIPINKINDGQAHYFSYKDQGRTIKFFVLKSRDGVIRAACDVCFPKRKGYSQAGDYLTCNNCGQRFHSSKINIIKGGCNPAPLNRVNKGEFLVITAADILTGNRYF